VIAPRLEFYPEHETSVSILFDLRYPGTVERLYRERVAWRGFETVEHLTDDHRVLVVRPGGALAVRR
jgi:hypothetical protein